MANIEQLKEKPELRARATIQRHLDWSEQSVVLLSLEDYLYCLSNDPKSLMN